MVKGVPTLRITCACAQKVCQICSELDGGAIAVSMSPSDNHHVAGDVYVSLGKVLTDSEVRVLQKVVDCPTETLAAGELGISYQTVRRHLSHARSKIGVATTIQAVMWAFRHGLIQ